MSSTYTPNVTAQDAIKRHLAEQHPGSGVGSSVGTVASAAALNVAGKRVVFVTGTTTITSLTGGKTGQVVTLSFNAATPITSAATLALAGGTDFTASDLDTLTLLCVDQTASPQVWTQVAQSANAA
jgi:hypothetical protein